MHNPFPILRRVAIAEGISFLLLLGIAMPLKYLASLPVAVVIAGWIHGILFVAFCIAWQRTRTIARLPGTRAALVFAGALLPFGPFVLDRRLRGWEQEHLRRLE